jgi:hypothetical protein
MPGASPPTFSTAIRASRRLACGSGRAREMERKTEIISV